MSQAARSFPDDDRPLQILVEAMNRLGRTAERKAAAKKLTAGRHLNWWVSGFRLGQQMNSYVKSTGFFQC